MKQNTIVTLADMKARGEKISQLTCYDYSTARLMDQAGINMILVGDSLGMTMQGYSDTIPVTMEEMIVYGRSVVRGCENTFVVVDMPFMSYQASVEQAVVNAGRLMKETGCDAVKLEGGREVCDQIRAITAAGIPVCAHVGMTPQSHHAFGGFKVQGKGEEGAARVLADAMAVQAAGAFAVVLECVPPKLAALITRKLDTGLTLDLPEPEKLGWDRVVDAAWAAAHYPLPLVTVDLGTCTTLNVVRRGGIFTGGVIAAGVETGIRALARNTAQLSAVKLKTPDHIIGKNTAECMLSGAVAGTAAMLDGLVQRIEEELGEPVTLVTTGGAARLVEPLLRHAHTHDPEMLTLGLAYLYDRNRAQCPLANEEAE